MSKFAAFMAGNVEKVENKKIVISNRFKDENGKPQEWEIKVIPAAENEELQRRCMVNVPVPGQRNVYSRELDRNKYAAALAAACVVYPDLNNAELQDSYGVKGADALLLAMLYNGEYNKLFQAVTAMNNFETLGEQVQAAKN